MTKLELLDRVESNAIGHQRRAIEATRHLSAEQFNKAAGREWSVAHVFKHLCLADGPYLLTIGSSLASDGASLTSTIVKHSWLGRLLIKASGPDGNAPVPGFLIPPSLPLSMEVIDEWVAKKSKLIKLAEVAKGKDVNMRVRNPFLKFVKLTLADMFAIMDVHTERHVRQIEVRSKLAA